MTPKPESETDPWQTVKRYQRHVGGTFLSPVGRWCFWHEVDAARAAEATQHRARLAAVEAERDAKSRLIAELEGEAKDLKYHPISGIYAIEAERDRLKAALSQATHSGLGDGRERLPRIVVLAVVRQPCICRPCRPLRGRNSQAMSEHKACNRAVCMLAGRHVGECEYAVQPPATPQEPEPYGPFFDPCGKCVTRTHCAHHDRCLAECVPADLRASTPSPASLTSCGADTSRGAEMKAARVGDWIRYQRDGRLVVGVVAYIRPRAAWDSTPIPWTVEHGPVEPAGIVELRSAEEQP